MESSRDRMVAIVQGLHDAGLAVTLTDASQLNRVAGLRSEAPPFQRSSFVQTNHPVYGVHSSTQATCVRPAATTYRDHFQHRTFPPPHSPPPSPRASQSVSPQVSLLSRQFRINELRAKGLTGSNLQRPYTTSSGHLARQNTRTLREVHNVRSYRSSLTLDTRGAYGSLRPSRAADAFADSLRKYPQSAPSTDFIQRLLDYTQAKSHSRRRATRSLGRRSPDSDPEAPSPTPAPSPPLPRKSSKNIQTYTRAKSPARDVAAIYGGKESKKPISPRSSSSKQSVPDTYDYLHIRTASFGQPADVRYLSDVTQRLYDDPRATSNEAVNMDNQVGQTLLARRPRPQTPCTSSGLIGPKRTKSDWKFLQMRSSRASIEELSVCTEVLHNVIDSIVHKWLEEVPTYISLTAEETNIKNTLIENLKTQLVEHIDDESVCKREIMKFLNSLSMWLPPNTVDRQMFKKDLAVTLLQRIKDDLKSKEGFGDIIHDWVEAIPLKARPYVDKQKFAIDLTNELKKIALGTSNDEVKEDLKYAILQELETLPVNCDPSRRRDVLSELAETLADRLAIDRFGQTVHNWVAKIPINPRACVDKEKFSEYLIKKLKHVVMQCNPVEIEDALIQIIFEELSDLPLDVIPSRKQKYLNALTRGLVDKLSSTIYITIQGWEDGLNEEERNMLEYLKNRPDCARISSTEIKKAAKDLTKELRKLESQGLSSCKINQIMKAIICNRFSETIKESEDLDGGVVQRQQSFYNRPNLSCNSVRFSQSRRAFENRRSSSQVKFNDEVNKTASDSDPVLDVPEKTALDYLKERPGFVNLSDVEIHVAEKELGKNLKLLKSQGVRGSNLNEKIHKLIDVWFENAKKETDAFEKIALEYIKLRPEYAKMSSKEIKLAIKELGKAFRDFKLQGFTGHNLTIHLQRATDVILRQRNIDLGQEIRSISNNNKKQRAPNLVVENNIDENIHSAGPSNIVLEPRTASISQDKVKHVVRDWVDNLNIKSGQHLSKDEFALDLAEKLKIIIANTHPFHIGDTIKYAVLEEVSKFFDQREFSNIEKLLPELAESLSRTLTDGLDNIVITWLDENPLIFNSLIGKRKFLIELVKTLKEIVWKTDVTTKRATLKCAILEKLKDSLPNQAGNFNEVSQNLADELYFMPENDIEKQVLRCLQQQPNYLTLSDDDIREALNELPIEIERVQLRNMGRDEVSKLLKSLCSSWLYKCQNKPIKSVTSIVVNHMKELTGAEIDKKEITQIIKATKEKIKRFNENGQKTEFIHEKIKCHLDKQLEKLFKSKRKPLDVKVREILSEKLTRELLSKLCSTNIKPSHCMKKDLINAFQKDIYDWIKQPAFKYASLDDETTQDLSEKMAEYLVFLKIHGTNSLVTKQNMIEEIKKAIDNDLFNRKHTFDMKTKDKLADSLLKKLDNTAETVCVTNNSLSKKPFKKTSNAEIRAELNDASPFTSVSSLFNRPDIEQKLQNIETEDKIQNITTEIRNWFDGTWLSFRKIPSEKMVTRIIKSVISKIVNLESQGFNELQIRKQMASDLNFKFSYALKKESIRMDAKNKHRLIGRLLDKILEILYINNCRTTQQLLDSKNNTCDTDPDKIKRDFEKLYKTKINHWIENVPEFTSKNSFDKKDKEILSNQLARTLAVLKSKKVNTEECSKHMMRAIINALNTTFENMGKEVKLKLTYRYAKALLKDILNRATGDVSSSVSESTTNSKEKIGFPILIENWLENIPDINYQKKELIQGIGEILNKLSASELNMQHRRKIIVEMIIEKLNVVLEYNHVSLATRKKYILVNKLLEDIEGFYDTDSFLDSTCTFKDTKKERDYLLSTIEDDVIDWLGDIPELTAKNPLEKKTNEKMKEKLLKVLNKLQEKGMNEEEIKREMLRRIKACLWLMLNNKNVNVNSKRLNTLSRQLWEKIGNAMDIFETFSYTSIEKSSDYESTSDTSTSTAHPNSNVAKVVLKTIRDWVEKTPEFADKEPLNKKESKKVVRSLFDILSLTNFNELSDVDSKNFVQNKIKRVLDKFLLSKSKRVDTKTKYRLADEITNDVKNAIDPLNKKSSTIKILQTGIKDWIEEIPELKPKNSFEKQQIRALVRSLAKQLSRCTLDSNDSYMQRRMILEVKSKFDSILSSKGLNLESKKKNALTEKLVQRLINYNDNTITPSIAHNKATKESYDQTVLQTILYWFEGIPKLASSDSFERNENKKFSQSLAKKWASFSSTGLTEECNDTMLEEINKCLDDALKIRGVYIPFKQRFELAQKLIDLLVISSSTDINNDMHKEQNSAIVIKKDFQTNLVKQSPQEVVTDTKMNKNKNLPTSTKDTNQSSNDISSKQFSLIESNTVDKSNAISKEHGKNIDTNSYILLKPKQVSIDKSSNEKSGTENGIKRKRWINTTELSNKDPGCADINSRENPFKNQMCVNANTFSSNETQNFVFARCEDENLSIITEDEIEEQQNNKDNSTNVKETVKNVDNANELQNVLDEIKHTFETNIANKQVNIESADEMVKNLMGFANKIRDLETTLGVYVSEGNINKEIQSNSKNVTDVLDEDKRKELCKYKDGFHLKNLQAHVNKSQDLNMSDKLEPDFKETHSSVGEKTLSNSTCKQLTDNTGSNLPVWRHRNVVTEMSRIFINNDQFEHSERKTNESLYQAEPFNRNKEEDNSFVNNNNYMKEESKVSDITNLNKQHKMNCNKNEARSDSSNQRKDTFDKDTQETSFSSPKNRNNFDKRSESLQTVNMQVILPGYKHSCSAPSSFYTVGDLVSDKGVKQRFGQTNLKKLPLSQNETKIEEIPETSSECNKIDKMKSQLSKHSLVSKDNQKAAGYKTKKDFEVGLVMRKQSLILESRIKLNTNTDMCSKTSSKESILLQEAIKTLLLDGLQIYHCNLLSNNDIEKISKHLSDYLNNSEVEDLREDQFKNYVMIYLNIQLGCPLNNKDLINSKTKTEIVKYFYEGIVYVIDQMKKEIEIRKTLQKHIDACIRDVFENIPSSVHDKIREDLVIRFKELQMKGIERNELIFEMQRDVKDNIDAISANEGINLSPQAKNKITESLISVFTTFLRNDPEKSAFVKTRDACTQLQSLISLVSGIYHDEKQFEKVILNIVSKYRNMKKESQSIIDVRDANNHTTPIYVEQSPRTRETIASSVKHGNTVSTNTESANSQHFQFYSSTGLTKTEIDKMVDMWFKQLPQKVTVGDYLKSANSKDKSPQDLNFRNKLVFDVFGKLQELKSQEKVDNNATIGNRLSYTVRTNDSNDDTLAHTPSSIENNCDLSMNGSNSYDTQQTLASKCNSNLATQLFSDMFNVPVKIENDIQKEMNTIFENIPDALLKNRSDEMIEIKKLCTNIARKLSEASSTGNEIKAIKEEVLKCIKNAKLNLKLKQFLCINLSMKIPELVHKAEKVTNILQLFQIEVLKWLEDTPETASLSSTEKSRNEKICMILAKKLFHLHSKKIDDAEIRRVMMEEILDTLDTALDRKDEQLNDRLKYKLSEKLFNKISYLAQNTFRNQNHNEVFNHLDKSMSPSTSECLQLDLLWEWFCRFSHSANNKSENWRFVEKLNRDLKKIQTSAFDNNTKKKVMVDFVKNWLKNLSSDKICKYDETSLDKMTKELISTIDIRNSQFVINKNQSSDSSIYCSMENSRMNFGKNFKLYLGHKLTETPRRTILKGSGSEISLEKLGKIMAEFHNENTSNTSLDGSDLDIKPGCSRKQRPKWKTRHRRSDYGAKATKKPSKRQFRHSEVKNQESSSSSSRSEHVQKVSKEITAQIRIKITDIIDQNMFTLQEKESTIIGQIKNILMIEAGLPENEAGMLAQGLVTRAELHAKTLSNAEFQLLFIISEEIKDYLDEFALTKKQLSELKDFIGTTVAQSVMEGKIEEEHKDEIIQHVMDVGNISEKQASKMIDRMYSQTERLLSSPAVTKAVNKIKNNDKTPLDLTLMEQTTFEKKAKPVVEEFVRSYIKEKPTTKEEKQIENFINGVVGGLGEVLADPSLSGDDKKAMMEGLIKTDLEDLTINTSAPTNEMAKDLMIRLEVIGLNPYKIRNSVSVKGKKSESKQTNDQLTGSKPFAMKSKYQKAKLQVVIEDWIKKLPTDSKNLKNEGFVDKISQDLAKNVEERIEYIQKHPNKATSFKESEYIKESCDKWVNKYFSDHELTTADEDKLVEAIQEAVPPIMAADSVENLIYDSIAPSSSSRKRDSYIENLTKYKTKLENVIEDWVNKLPIDSKDLKDKSFVDGMVRDLANEVVERQEYVIKHKNKKPTNLEISEYLKEKCDDWVQKYLSGHDLTTVDEEKLVNAIQQVMPPITDSCENLVYDSYTSSKSKPHKDSMVINLMKYKEKLENVIENWITKLPIESEGLKNEEFVDTMVQDLANDVVERQKFLEDNPDKKTTTVEETNYIKEKCGDWVEKYLSSHKNELTKDEEELVEAIKEVKAPIMDEESSKDLKSKDNLTDNDLSRFLSDTVPSHIKPIVDQNKMNQLSTDFTHKVEKLKSQPNSDKKVHDELRKYIKKVYGDLINNDLQRLELSLYKYLSKKHDLKINRRLSTTKKMQLDQIEDLIQQTSVDWLKNEPLYQNASNEEKVKLEKDVKKMVENVKKIIDNNSVNTDQKIKAEIGKNLKKIVKDSESLLDDEYVEETTDLLFNLFKTHVDDVVAPTDTFLTNAINNFVKSMLIEPKSLAEKKRLDDAKNYLVSRLKKIMENCSPSCPVYEKKLKDEIALFLRSNINEPGKRHNECYVDTKARELVKTICAGPLTTRKRDPKPFKKSADVLYDLIVNWCQNLSLQGDTDEINFMKQNLASQMINKIGELNVNPDVLNDVTLYEEILYDEFDKLLSRLPHSPEMHKYLPALKKDLILKIMEARKILIDELASKNYKQNLRNVIPKAMHLTNSLSTEEQASFDLFQDKVVDAFICLNYAENEEESAKFRSKISIDVERFCADIFGTHPCYMMDSNTVRQDLVSALRSIPVPKDDSMRSEVEQTRIKAVLHDWMKGIPLRQETNTEKLHRYKLVTILAKRIHDLEMEKEYIPSFQLQPGLDTEISKFVKKLPIRIDQEEKSPEIVKQLIRKLKATEVSRKFISMRRSVSTETDICNPCSYINETNRLPSMHRTTNKMFPCPRGSNISVQTNNWDSWKRCKLPSCQSISQGTQAGPVPKKSSHYYSHPTSSQHTETSKRKCRCSPKDSQVKRKQNDYSSGSTDNDYFVRSCRARSISSDESETQTCVRNYHRDCDPDRKSPRKGNFDCYPRPSTPEDYLNPFWRPTSKIIKPSKKKKDKLQKVKCKCPNHKHENRNKILWCDSCGSPHMS